MPTPAQHLPVTASVLLSLCYPVLPQLQRTPRFILSTFHSMAWSPQPSSSPQGGCWAQTPPLSTAPIPARLGCPALLAPLQSSTAGVRRVWGSLHPASASQHPHQHLTRGAVPPTLHGTPGHSERILMGCQPSCRASPALPGTPTSASSTPGDAQHPCQRPGPPDPEHPPTHEGCQRCPGTPSPVSAPKLPRAPTRDGGTAGTPRIHGGHRAPHIPGHAAG